MAGTSPPTLLRAAAEGADVSRSRSTVDEAPSAQCVADAEADAPLAPPGSKGLRETLMVINPERLQEVAMGDDEFMVELIDLYLRDAPAQLEALDRAVASQDATAVSAAAHKLKGSCGNIGAEGLLALCRKLEASVQANRFQEMAGLLQQVAREFGDVNAALHRVKAGTHPAPQEQTRGKPA